MARSHIALVCDLVDAARGSEFQVPLKFIDWLHEADQRRPDLTILTTLKDGGAVGGALTNTGWGHVATFQLPRADARGDHARRWQMLLDQVSFLRWVRAHLKAGHPAPTWVHKVNQVHALFHLLSALCLPRLDVVGPVSGLTTVDFRGRGLPLRQQAYYAAYNLATRAIAALFIARMRARRIRVLAATERDQLMLATRGVQATEISELSLERLCRQVAHAAAPQPGLSQPVPAKDRTSSPVRVAWVGSLIPRKRPDLALAVVRRALQRGCNLHLTVFGTGPLEQAMRARSTALGGHVTWRGGLERTQLLSELSTHDILLHTSIREVNGTALVEALCAGLRVVAADTAVNSGWLRALVDARADAELHLALEAAAQAVKAGPREAWRATTLGRIGQQARQEQQRYQALVGSSL